MARAISIKLPMTRDESEGFFKSNFDLIEVANQNFRDLILTNPGERPINTDYGVGVRNYLFEQDSTIMKEELAARIEDQKNIYLPYIDIEDILLITSEDDQEVPSNVLLLRIHYFVSPIGARNVLNIEINL